jgi:hypothetical protein
MNQRSYRNVLFISLSQFGIAFSFKFVMVFLPFFIHGIGTSSPQETLIWVGLIMGAPSFAAALASLNEQSIVEAETQEDLPAERDGRQ